MARRQGLGPQQTGSVSGVFSQEDGGVLQSQLTPDGLTSCIEAASGRAHGLFLWGHGAYAPDSWEGAYLLGIARFGFDVNRMQHSVNAGAYHSSHDSEWIGWSGAFMLGAGYDLFFCEARSVRLEPLAILQYVFTSHPSFEEDGDADALRIEVGCADSLAFLLSDHVDARKGIGFGYRLDAEIMAG